MHVCPMLTGTVPHSGGPVGPQGSLNVNIGNVPAARVGDSLICNGPPDQILVGSSTVLINGQPAARMGDQTTHGGSIVQGFPLVNIG